MRPARTVFAALTLTALLACEPVLEPEMSVAASSPPSLGLAKGATKVTICHKEKTVTVGEPAVAAHLAHGDMEGACGPPPATVFVSFDGVTLLRSSTTDDATTNVSALVRLSTAVIPAFNPAVLSNDGGLTRVEIIAATVAQLEAIHAPYNVAFTTTRPASGAYSMVVFGGSCSSVIGQAGCAGIAVQDCGNTFPSNISFVFPPGLRVEDLAVVAARQNALALGLDNTDNPDDVMFPVLQVMPPERFAGGNTLPGGCLAPGTFQDSHQRMLDVLGAS